MNLHLFASWGSRGELAPPWPLFSRIRTGTPHWCRRPRTDRPSTRRMAKCRVALGQNAPVLAGRRRPARRLQRLDLRRDIRMPATLPMSSRQAVPREGCGIGSSCRVSSRRLRIGRQLDGASSDTPSGCINRRVPAKPATVRQPGPAVAQGAGVSPSRGSGLGDRDGFPPPRGDGSYRNRDRVDGIIPAFAGMTVMMKATSASRRAREHRASRPPGMCGEGVDIAVRARL